MQEHQVTVARQRFPLEPPFFVLATQNPLEMEGTYPLPEAQLDRFLFKVMVPFPSEEDLVTIMDRTTGADTVTAAKVDDRRRDRRDAAPRPRGPDRAARHGLRGQRPRGDPPRPAPSAGARPRVRPLRRLAARRPGARHGRQDLRPARRTLQRLGRRHPRGRPARRCATGSSSTSRARPRGSRPRRPSGRSSTRWPRPRSSSAAVTQSPDERAPAGGRRAAAPRSCRTRSTRPSSTRRSCASSSGCCCSCASPVRGGLKGGRRSVKRGQSVEFADYRDYALGDDLRQLDWNVFARLEKLFVKLFVEEEDVTITLLLDASASMASGPAREAPVREAGGGRARLHRARVRGPRRDQRARWPDEPPAGRPARLRSRVPAAARACRRSSRPPGPTDLVAAARHAAAQLSGRGVDRPDQRPARPGGGPGDPRARRDALGADRAPRPLARRARPAARGRPPPRRRRDRRRHRHHRGPADARRLSPAPRRVEGVASPTSPPGARRATSTCRRRPTSTT